MPLSAANKKPLTQTICIKGIPVPFQPCPRAGNLCGLEFMARFSDLRDQPTLLSNLPGYSPVAYNLKREFRTSFYSSGTVVDLHNLP